MPINIIAIVRMFHYQSLHQPGIVCGLGVSVIPAPADLPAQYRDGRWLQIQSGIAIDLVGNPIIVPQPIDFSDYFRGSQSTSNRVRSNQLC